MVGGGAWKLICETFFFFIFTYGGILMPMQILEMLQLCALWYFYAQNEWDLYYERNDATLPPCNTGDRSREQQGKWLNKDPIPVRKTGADQWHHVGPLYGTNRWSWAELVSFWLTLLGDALLTRPLLRGSSVINNTEGDGSLKRNAGQKRPPTSITVTEVVANIKSTDFFQQL